MSSSPHVPLLPDDPGFPAALRDLPRGKLAPCEALYTRGAWPPWPGVAVVGTRQATAGALDFTRELSSSIVKAGYAVWSGGARGIDRAAHEGALDAGGATVVVSPSSLAVTYPPEHEELFARIVDGGGMIVTPFPDPRGPTLGSFHRRNNILAALTIATVVVQAGAQSGARSAARAARRLSRPLFVVPGAPWEDKGLGCAIELALGASPVASGKGLVAKLAQLPGVRNLAPLGPLFDRANEASPRASVHAHAVTELGEDAMRVFAAIEQMPMHTDDLCEHTALPFARVAAALLTLTLHAVVVEAPAGFYRRQPR